MILEASDHQELMDRAPRQDLSYNCYGHKTPISPLMYVFMQFAIKI